MQIHAERNIILLKIETVRTVTRVSRTKCEMMMIANDRFVRETQVTVCTVSIFKS